MTFAAGFAAGVLFAIGAAIIMAVLGVGEAERALSDPEHALDGNSPFFDRASGNGGGILPQAERKVTDG